MNEEHSLDYQRINVVKGIIENPQGEILLIQEPDMNEWMPGRWGLPGGRAREKQSLVEAFSFKMEEDLGTPLRPEGLYKIEELLIDARTVLMFLMVAKVKADFIPGGQTFAHKWVDANKLQAMDVADFTEFYNKNVLLEYLRGDKKLTDLDLVQTHEYYLFSGNSEYKRWWDRGEK